jgi:serine/threonine protein kinase
MKCPKCGTDVAGGSAFCPNCGAVTKDPTAATVALSLEELQRQDEVRAAPPQEDPLLVSVREALSQYYIVQKELGRGGMAVVYQGKERGLEREVAIKVLPPDLALQGGTADRFRREARLAASLEHTNIIPVYRVGEEKGHIYMAMKFVRGRPLDSIIEQQGALPVPVVARVLAAAAAGLAHAHDHKIVHRDIKGANILIELDGRVLVSDFGIARAMTENSLTASGMIVGTPNFMSPEQCGGSKVGPQSDQYSLGILAFQMLTGQLPFEADSFMGIIQHHYMTPPPDIRQVREGVPDDLLAIIYKALEKLPENRFATTHEMAERFDAVNLTAEEKRDAANILKQLSHGNRVSEVRTASLPPLSITASISGPRQRSISGITTGQAPAVPIRKKGLGLGIAAAALVVLGGGGAGGYMLWHKSQLQQQATDSTLAALSARQAAVPETVRVDPPTPTGSSKAPAQQRTTTQLAAPGSVTQAAPTPAAPVGNGTIQVSVVGCLSAEILVDGQRMGAGRWTGQVPAGHHTVRVTAAEDQNPFEQGVDIIANTATPVVVRSITCGG